jgi:hypothetical protein
VLAPVALAHYRGRTYRGGLREPRAETTGRTARVSGDGSGTGARSGAPGNSAAWALLARSGRFICLRPSRDACADDLVACFELLVVDGLIYDAHVGHRLAGSVDHVRCEGNEPEMYWWYCSCGSTPPQVVATFTFSTLPRTICSCAGWVAAATGSRIGCCRNDLRPTPPAAPVATPASWTLPQSRGKLGKLAEPWYRRAADAGHRGAETRLGLLLGNSGRAKEPLIGLGEGFDADAGGDCKLGHPDLAPISSGRGILVQHLEDLGQAAGRGGTGAGRVRQLV